VNINAATEGVRVGSFEAAQPDDARNDRVAALCIRLEDFAGKPAVPEHRSGGRMVANFLRHLEETERGGHSPPVIAQTKLGSRNGIGGQPGAISHDHQLLVFHADDDAAGTIGAEGSGHRKKCDQQDRETNHYRVVFT
jgi:hypothetical protein